MCGQPIPTATPCPCHSVTLFSLDRVARLGEIFPGPTTHEQFGPRFLGHGASTLCNRAVRQRRVSRGCIWASWGTTVRPCTRARQLSHPLVLVPALSVVLEDAHTAVTLLWGETRISDAYLHGGSMRRVREKRAPGAAGRDRSSRIVPTRHCQCTRTGRLSAGLSE